MKKTIFLIMLFILSFNITYAISLPNDLASTITADSVVLLNLETNDIVYSKNPDKQEILASLTKIMTAYTVIENVPNLNEKVIITEKDIANLYGFTCAGLQVGDKVTYLDLLYATILHSGADASQALAIHTSGSIEEFNDLMNEEAKKLGLKKSHFADSYGGDDNNISTAREMSRLLKKALQNETFKKIFTTMTKTLTNGLQVTNYSQSIATFHGLDSSLLVGNKSGYTPEAGLLLASLTNINNTDYILIVMKSDINAYMSTHVLDTYKIFHYISEINFVQKTLLEKGTILKRIPVENSTINEYVVISDEQITATITEEDYQKLNYDYHIIDKLTPEHSIGDHLGYVDIFIGDEVIATYNIYLKDEIFSLQEEAEKEVVVIVAVIFIAIVLFGINLFSIKKVQK